MIAQFRTEAVMRERLAELGHRPHFGRRLAGFEQDESGVTARIVDARGKHLVRARFLIGTDGGRSFVRHALNIGFPGETLGVRALVADVRLEGLDRLAWHRFQIGSPRRSSWCAHWRAPICSSCRGQCRSKAISTSPPPP
jgi:2-polyprenyl-6-methoxyphenol hydroxylase-like FAD-dependent oxidoreductase